MCCSMCCCVVLGISPLRTKTAEKVWMCGWTTFGLRSNVCSGSGGSAIADDFFSGRMMRMMMRRCSTERLWDVFYLLIMNTLYDACLLGLLLMLYSSE